MESLCDSLEKQVIENRDCLKAEHMDMDINHLMTRFKQMEAKIERVKDKANTRFDPDVSIIICGIHYEEGDNVMGLVKS